MVIVISKMLKVAFSLSVSLLGHYGQLGHGTENSTDEPTLVDYFPSHRMCVKDVVCGLWNTFVSAVPKEQPPS